MHVCMYVCMYVCVDVLPYIIINRGKFDERPVAVKRLLPECFGFADREASEGAGLDLYCDSDSLPYLPSTGGSVAAV